MRTSSGARRLLVPPIVLWRCFMRRLLIVLVALAPFAFSSVPAADQPGQADLDQAADLQVSAETLGDLEKVIKLAESALSKGLDKDQKEFASTLLAATLYQH